ncbi:MAG TPA: sulfotransferase, partial [Sphingomonadales bacterium]|nr:sulfotransferase [Sphingomonadales bacterium]
FQKIAESDAPVDTRAAALLSAGKILDGLGRFEEAFKAFSEGKQLRKSLPEFAEFDLEAAERHLEEAKTLAAEKFPLAQVERDPDEPDLLVFFVGFPRSGTTLLQEVMHAHPDITVAEEKSIASVVRIMLNKLGPDFRTALANLTPAEAALLRRVYFLQAAALKPWDGKKVFVDKMPLNLTLLPFLRRVFPEAKVLLGLRHPCSAVLSCLMQDFQPNNAMVHMMTLDSITHYYDGVMGLWLALAADPAFAPLVVKYEDMVKNLETQARRVTDFFGLPFSPEMLAYAEKAKARGMIRTPSYSQVVRPIYTEAVERWKNYASHLAPFQARLAPYIKAFGYSE